MALTKAAMIQFSGSLEKEKNIEKSRTYIAQAVEGGAQIICLQELFNTTYFCYEENYDHCSLAEPVPGPTTDLVAEAAKKFGMVI